MPERHVSFEHDGHRFVAHEHRSEPAAGREPIFAWQVTMDGQPALEFTGGYPYRDDDVRKRILEWYEIQK